MTHTAPGLLIAAAMVTPAAAAPWTGTPATGTQPAAHGIDLAGIDRTVLPGDDFFRYANGAWLKSAEIPADRSSYGTGAVLAELNTQRTVALIKGAALAPAGSDARKIGDY